MFGEWKRIAEPYGQMVLGYFGKTPVPPDADVVKIASEQLGLEPTTQPPLERNDADPEKGIEAARKQLAAEGLPETDENIFIVAACKDKGLAFLNGEGEVGVRKIDKKVEQPASAEEPASYTLTVDGREFQLSIDGDRATVDGQVFSVGLQESTGAPTAASGGQGQPVKAEMPGKVIRILMGQGSSVTEGETLLVLEAMKMEMQIASPVTGTVRSVDVSEGEQIAAGATLLTIG